MTDNTPHEEPTLPAPYPLDDAMAHAYSPEIDVDRQRVKPAAIAGQQGKLATQDTSDHAAAGQRRTADDGPCSVSEGTSAPSEHALAHATHGLRDQPPETVAERLASLAPWQAGYVLALMETGGVMGMACVRCRVSRMSVEKALKANPGFAAACAEATAHSTDLIEAAVIRGATIGDLGPVYQGGKLVGYKRVRNTKDAELALTIRGRMPDQQVQVTHTGRVALLDESQMAERLAQVARLLHGQPEPMKAIEGKVVSESDTKGS